MMDARHFELLHAELDGELDAAGRAELARCLSENTEMAQWHQDLKQLTASLDGLERVAPPASLAADILAALPPPSVRQGQTTVVRLTPAGLRRAVPGGWPVWAMAASLAGLAFAGSMLLPVDSASLSDSSQLAGTLVKAERSVGQLDSVALDFAGLQGRVATYQTAAGVSLDFAVTARAAVQIRVHHAGGELLVDHLAKTTGYQHFTVHLPGSAAGEGAVRLQFLVNGQELGTASLKGPVPQPPAAGAQ